MTRINFKLVLFLVFLPACGKYSPITIEGEISLPQSIDICKNSPDAQECNPDVTIASCQGAPAGTVEVRTRYQLPSATSSQVCQPQTQKRMCQNGTFTEWDGTFTAESCSQNPTTDSTAACDGVPHGTIQSQIRYFAESVPFNQLCQEQTQTRTCTSGVFSGWSGDFTKTSCSVQPQTPSTNTPCGTVAHGTVENRTYFLASSVPFQQICTSQNQTRTCQNGTFTAWSGTYTNASCSAANPSNCGSISHLGFEERTRYQTPSVASGQTCAAETQRRTCNNGTLSNWTGSFAEIGCQVQSYSVTQLVNGRYKAYCGILSDGTMKCWGGNGQGDLGFGHNNSPILKPTLVSGLSVLQASIGSSHGCAVLKGNSVKCWGLNNYGQLGLGHKTNTLTPTTIPGLVAKQVLAGNTFTCAVLTDGSVKCWGNNDVGQLGIGTNVQTSTPTLISSLKVKKLAVGGGHACAIFPDDSVKCWGDNYAGALGIGSKSNRNAPTVVNGLRAKQISLSTYHSCAVQMDDTVRCWGFNMFGQLGNGVTSDSLTPSLINGLTAKYISAGGGDHTCAILLDDTVKCWGKNSSGELGLGHVTNRTVPTLVSGLKAKVIEGGNGQTCAISLDNTVKCWGDNTQGQLGINSTTAVRSPTTVLFD